MKWILAILLFVSASANAQIGLRDDSTKYIRYQNQYGSRLPRFWADSALHMPYFDTTIVKPQKAGAIMMHLDKNVYKWNGGGWEALAGTPLIASNGLTKINDTIKLGGYLTGATRISGGINGHPFVIDSAASISLFSGLEFISSGVGSSIQMSDSVTSIGSSSVTDFTSFIFSPTRIKFTAADGAGSAGDVWTNTGAGYGHWAPPDFSPSDTTNKWINNLRRRQGTDTVEYFKNGSWQFAYKDSIGGGGGSQDLQDVTDIDNETTNDLIVGSRTNSAGAVSVEKTFTVLDQHSFDDYSILNPSSGGTGFGTFDASTTMQGSVNNDHFNGLQSRLNYNSSGTLNGVFGMTGLYVRNVNTTGTVTNAHGIYIEDVAVGSGGTTTNKYGLRIKPVTGGSTLNYAILSEGGTNEFVGPAIFGNTITGANDLAIVGSSRSIAHYAAGSPTALTDRMVAVFQHDGSAVNFYTIATGSNSGNVRDFVFSQYNGSSLDELFRSKASNGNFGIGQSTPTATLHLRAGTATAGSAPIKLASGTNLTTPEAGVIEYDGTDYFATNSTARYTISRTLKGTTNWTPGVVSAGSSTSTTVSVTGAAVGDPVTICKLAAYSNGEIYDAFVSATNTVTIRVHNVSTGSANYNSAADYNVIVLKY